MRVYVQNVSTVVSNDELLNAFPAFRRQTYHVREWWRTTIEDLIFGEPPVQEAWQIIVSDDADQAGALGYHDFTPGGRPISYVFAKTAKDNGYLWTVTFSHELVEMITDPWISTAMQTGAKQFHALELCDPVESDDQGYDITSKGHGPVRVSNFVTPNWFVPGAPPIYDYRHECTKPLQIMDGGYAYVYISGTWYAEDHTGARKTAAEAPERQRLQLYARYRDG